MQFYSKWLYEMWIYVTTKKCPLRLPFVIAGRCENSGIIKDHKKAQTSSSNGLRRSISVGEPLSSSVFFRSSGTDFCLFTSGRMKWQAELSLTCLPDSGDWLLLLLLLLKTHCASALFSTCSFPQGILCNFKDDWTVYFYGLQVWLKMCVIRGGYAFFKVGLLEVSVTQTCGMVILQLGE